MSEQRHSKARLEALGRLVTEALGRLLSVNGNEQISMAILKWTQTTGVDWHYIAPRKPQQNALVESFIGGLRESLAW